MKWASIYDVDRFLGLFDPLPPLCAQNLIVAQIWGIYDPLLPLQCGRHIRKPPNAAKYHLSCATDSNIARASLCVRVVREPPSAFPSSILSLASASFSPPTIRNHPHPSEREREAEERPSYSAL